MPDGCARWREDVSASIDGEDVSDPAGLQAHLAGCAACRTFEEQAHRTSRLARLAPAGHAPDLVAAVLAATPAGRAPRPTRRARRRALALRAGLAAAALAQLALAAGAGLEGGDPAHHHAARDLAVFEAAVATGLLWAAARPSRVAGLLPVLATLAVAVTLTAALHVRTGAATASAEAAHLLPVVGLLLLTALRRRSAGGMTPA